MKHYLKWFILVAVNTVISVIILLEDSNASWQIVSGIIAGIFTYILLYAHLDQLLIKKKFERWRNSLQKGVVISALLYLAIPFIPIVTGAFALDTTSSNIDHPSLIGIYFTVMLDGLVLSALAMIPVSIIYLLKKHLGRPKD